MSGVMIDVRLLVSWFVMVFIGLFGGLCIATISPTVLPHGLRTVLGVPDVTLSDGRSDPKYAACLASAYAVDYCRVNYSRFPPIFPLGDNSSTNSSGTGSPLGINPNPGNATSQSKVGSGNPAGSHLLYIDNPTQNYYRLGENFTIYKTPSTQDQFVNTITLIYINNKAVGMNSEKGLILPITELNGFLLNKPNVVSYTVTNTKTSHVVDSGVLATFIVKPK